MLRIIPKLTHRHHPAGCFGVAPRLLTPTRQKFELLTKLPYIVGSFHPHRGSASALPIRSYRPLRVRFYGAVGRVVHRT